MVRHVSGCKDDVDMQRGVGRVPKSARRTSPTLVSSWDPEHKAEVERVYCCIRW